MFFTGDSLSDGRGDRRLQGTRATLEAIVRASRIAGLLVLGLLYAEPAAAQQYRGHLRGRILTAERPAAAGVSMRITSEATGETRRFTSDDEAAVTDLLPG